MGAIRQIGGEDIDELWVHGTQVTAANLTATAGVTAGTVTASKVVIASAAKDISAFRNLELVTLLAGRGGVKGYVTIYPTTDLHGHLAITCADQTGDTVVQVDAAAMGQATVVTLGDPGAATANLVMATTGQVPTCAEVSALRAAAGGTVVASRAVVVDASKDIASFRNVTVQNLDAGASGVVGTVDVFPATAARGKLAISCADQTGDTTVAFSAAAMAAARDIQLVDPGHARTVGVCLNALPPRYRLEWTAGQRGKPSLNADIQNAAEATRMIADPDFEVLGTNASSDDVTFYAEGGIKMETDGADGDEVILLPHLDANQSAWTQTTWGSDQQTRWEARIRTTGNISNMIIWAGLKLTNTEVIATDDDQVMFRYEDDVNAGKWSVVDSIANVDVSTDTAVAVAIDTAYHLVIDIAADRVARCYLNGVLVRTTNALTNAKDFIPYIGVAADGAAAAKSLVVRSQAIERNFA